MEGKQQRQRISFEPQAETKKQAIHATVHGGAAAAPCYAEMAHLATPSDQKPNCLCSPTTHVGSFRCRYHRASSLGSRGASFNNLTNLDDQSQTPQQQ